MKRFTWIAALVLAAAATAGAAPGLVNYQGILTDDTGAPLDGSYSLTFNIYPDSSNMATSLWTENHPVVDVSEGLFHVILGSTAPITDDLFAGDVRWLGITVGADAEIAPRTKITSVPWALRAAVADTVLNSPGGGSGDGHSLDAADGDPADVVYVNQFGQVGVGTTDPNYFLHFQMDYNNPLVFSIENTSTGTNAGEVLQLLGGPNTWFNIAAHDDEHASMSGAVTINNQRPGANIQIRQNGVEHMRIDSVGNVGIGVWNPSYRLDVNGSFRADSFRMFPGASSGYVLTTDAVGNGTWQPPAAVSDGDWTIDGDHMYSTAAGNVGVGTTAPVADLHVVGSDTLGTLMVAPGLTVNEHSKLVLAEDSDGTYSMDWRYNGDLNHLELWGVASSTDYGPHLTFERNSGATAFSGTGNSAILLPQDGVDATEMFDEPGVACSLWTGAVQQIYNTPHTMISRSITVPNGGYVLALATAWVQIFVSSTFASDCDFVIDDQNAVMPTDNVYALSLAGFNGTGNYNFPVTLQTVFEVPTAGTYTYYLLADEVLGDYSCFDRQMTLVYLPTAYGIVNSALTTAGAAPGEDAAETEAANTARLEREMDELRSQVEELRSAVEMD